MNPLRFLTHYYRICFKWKKMGIHLRPRWKDLVLDIGSGDGPSPSADVLCDFTIDDDIERTAPLRLDRPFVLGDVEHLPFVDGAFDFVYCSHLLEHVRSPDKAIAELQRVARSGYLEVPSEYFEKAVMSSAAHLWYIRLEDGTLVFRPKNEGVPDPHLNHLFHTLLMPDPLYAAFHWARLYTVMFIGFFWKKTIPYRIEGLPPDETHFAKAFFVTPSPTRLKQLESAIAQARKITRTAPPPVFWTAPIKKLIRYFYRSGKSIRLADIVACPFCKHCLQESPENTSLTCSSCKIFFPLIDGVPCLTPAFAQTTL